MRHIQKTRRVVARQVRRILHWWHTQDTRYKWYWRTGNILLALLVVSGIVLPILNNLITDNRYELTPTAHELVGTTDSRLSKQLSWDDRSQAWTFNAAGLSATANLPGGAGAASAIAAMRAQVGTPGGSSSDTPTYSLTLPKDLSKGVTYTDTNTGLSFSLIPEFKSWPGRIVDGHIVYPLEHGLQAIYTLKHNGLKEDIYIPHPDKYQTYSMNLYYKTKLPKTLELKKIPNGDGALGLYSADPTLFGNVSTSSDKDSENLQKARETGDKTNLVFGLPAPVVVAPKGQSTKNALGRFEVFQDQLMVIADNLHNLTTPVSLDPSVVVTSSSDFQTNGNNEGMIDFGTSGQITRGGLTGGTMGSWGATGGNYFSSCAGVGTVAYNGYLYITGCNGGDTKVEYAAINSDGTLGSLSNTTSMGTARGYHRLEVYNGYLYAIGGASVSGSTTYYNTVEYAPIASNGQIGAWQTASSFTTARSALASAVYNGYLYIMGGYDGSNVKNDVQYAPIKADGSLGSWASTSSFTTTRSSLGGFAYNGYLYIAGGYNAASTYYSDVQYAKLNSDGTVGSWMTTTSFTTGRAGPQVTVYNGYAYVMGGTSNTTSTLTDTQYAQLNANGTIGTWRTSSTLSTGVWSAGTAAYNGYLYVSTGTAASGTNVSTTQYAAIDRAGKPVAFGTLTNTFGTARALSCAVAYNGYLYNIGGSTNDSSLNNVTTVQYTALNSSTGNNGSWSSTTALPVARGSAGCVAYNGYIYVVGGYESGSIKNTTYYTAVNSNGTLGGSWTTNSNNLPSVVKMPGVFTYGTSSGTNIYVIQEGTVANVMYATIDTSTGAIGSWTDAGQSMVNSYGNRAYAQVGKYLYAFGGHNGNTTAYSGVEYTSINNNGSINAWVATTSLNTAIGFTKGTTVNGCIYSVGGENGATTSLNAVQYACPNANGTISAWYNAPNLTVATTDLGVASYNGYLYGVGGYTTGVVATTQYAYVNHGGSGATGTWGTTTSYGSSGQAVRAVAYNGYLYHIGGNGGDNDAQYAAINADGTVGSWAATSSLSTGRGFHGAFAYNGYMYALGGCTSNCSSLLATAEYAPINANGTLGSWQSTSSFSTARTSFAYAVYNGYAYILGGYDGSGVRSDVQYAPINTNGTLGSWSSTTSFTTTRSSNMGFAYNGYLYVLGGYDAGSTFYNDVQYAPLSSNGTVGSWTYTSSFAVGRASSGVVAANGFVYLMGGTADVATSRTDTQYAPINANGTVGAWQSSTALGTGVWNPGVAVYNGYIYLLNGRSTGPVNTTVTQYAPLNVIARTARYSKLIDLGIPTNISSITYNGTLPMSATTPGVIPISFRAAGNDGVFGSLTASSAITPGATGCLATSQNYKRYLLVTITLDDTTSALLADASGTLSNVTDFTVNYTPVHPPPNIRLRHGQTLQQGNLSALDTCTP